MILAGRTTVLTARQPDPALTEFCQRHGLVLVRISSTVGTHTPGGPGTQPDAGWIDVRLADGASPGVIRALAANPALTVIVRPDRVIAAAGTRHGLPRLPWYLPAIAAPERLAPVPPAHHPQSASPVTTTPRKFRRVPAQLTGHADPRRSNVRRCRSRRWSFV